MNYRLLTVVALLGLAHAGQAQDLVVKGKTQTIITEMPFTVEAPAGYFRYTWAHPGSFVVKKKAAHILEVTAAPEGTHTIEASALKVEVDFDKKVFDIKDMAWSVTVNVGKIAPPVPPDPPPPVPPGPASKIGIVLLKDSRKDDNPERLTLLAQAKTFADSKGHTVWVRDVSSVDAASYTEAAKAVGTPALVFIDATGKQRGKAVKLPDTLDAIRAVVAEHGGLTDSGIQLDDIGEFVVVGGQKRYLTAKRTPAAKMRAFRAWDADWPVIPQSEWRDFTMADLALPRILDQDGRGACVGHGACGAFELAWRFNLRQHLEFCPWFIYGNINGGRDAGAFVGDSLTSMQKQGVSLWGTIPYSEYRSSRFPAKAYEEAKRFKPEMVYWTKTFEDIGSAAQRGHPVVFGCEIGNAFNPDSRGVIPAQRGGGGGHCMFVAGVRKIDGQWYLHIINSWGTSWGLNGTCYMPKSYFTDLSDAYAIATPALDPQDPQPLPKLTSSLLGMMDRRDDYHAFERSVP